MMRFIICSIYAVVLLFPWARGGAEVVFVGISTPGLYEIPTEIAQRKGFYKSEGLEVRKVVVRTNLHVPALIAGELDYSTVSGIIGRASIQGLPVKGVMGWFDRPLHMLIGRPGIKKLTDLKGKRIAVSAMNSAPHIVLREAFIQAGMNPDKDAIILAVGGSGDRLAALMAGTVDATPVDVAYVEKAEKVGMIPVLYLGDVVNFRLRATLKGVRLLKENKPESLAIMRDYLSVSAPAAEKIYDFSLRSLNIDGLVAKSTMDAEIRLAKEQLKITEDIPEDKLMDWRFLKEATAQK